jgi:hypothetical protein
MGGPYDKIRQRVTELMGFRVLMVLNLVMRAQLFNTFVYGLGHFELEVTLFHYQHKKVL